MDLNQLAAPAVPERPPLRILRLGKARPAFDEPEPEVYQGGEALPESQGQDFPHPISDEERQALLDEGYDVDDPRQDPGIPTLAARRSLAQAMDAEEDRENEQSLMRRALIAQAEEDDRIAREYHQRECPMPGCGAIARIKKSADNGDVLGIGMSVNDAVELEQLLTEHLADHPLGEWRQAVLDLQAELARRDNVNHAAWTPQAPLPPAEGIIPGPTRRDPARQAAVDALDARLGRPRAPQAPQDVAEHDERLRELRRRRRAAEPTPYDLTPKWSAEQPNGVVGIKR